MRIVLKLGKSHDLLFLVFSFVAFFLLRLPSFFEPNWYGDEGVYQAIGEAINKWSLLYRDIWDNKPPLLYFLYALFNSDQFALRFVSFIFGAFSIVVFFFLSKKLFSHYFLTTSIFVILLGLPIIEGNIANAENFMMLPILLSAFLIYSLPKPHSKTVSFQLVAAGLLLGIAFLFKVVAIFDLIAFLIFLVIANIHHRFGLAIIKEKVLPLVFGFLMPFIIAVLYFWTQGTFADFVKASFSSNIGYVAWENKVIFSQDLLLLKTLLLGIVVVLIFVKRKLFSVSALFILLWFVFSLYSAFFTQRPYTHYLLVLLPSFCLLFGLIFSEKKQQKILTIFFIFALVLIMKNFNLYEKSISYYQNFASFLIGNKSVVSYQEFFDKRTPVDYKVASFIKSKLGKEETIFIWGNNAQLYKIIGTTPSVKYVVSYHVLSNEDGMSNIRKTIKATKPRFIIIMPDQEPASFELVQYFERISIDRVSIYERFF